MKAASVQGSQLPPEVTGDVDIARFSSSTERERWRVSIDGVVHFLTDRATAQRIHALSLSVRPNDSYEHAYARYLAIAGVDADADGESLAEFTAWCKTHFDTIEGLTTLPDGHALRLRLLILPKNICHHLAQPLTAMFSPAAALVAMTFSLWGVCNFLLHSPTQSGGSFLAAVCLALLGVLVHEVGHITGCVRNTGFQGGIGIGIYWIWPAFYADVRGSWSLPPTQRLQVSLGGLYFQSIFAACLGLASVIAEDATLAMATRITFLLMATTINPVMKYDGYWILSDLLNVTNLHTRVANHLRTMLTGKQSGRRKLLCSRWTAASLLFALVALGYMAYIVSELARTWSLALSNVPELWASAIRSHQGASAMDVATTYGHFAWAIFQLLLIGMALTILGFRSFSATLGIATNKAAAAC